MLMGEHAVLFGHRAIVCAVAQRLSVTLQPRSDNTVVVHSALGNYQGQLADVMAGAPCPDLAFVLAAIRAVQPLNGFELTIKSEFSHTVGLGSSAAVVAACVAALLEYHHGQFPDLATVFDTGLSVIHAVQGRGSGGDLAASVYGGMVGYTVTPRDIKPLLPADLSGCPRLALFYCGYKTPTPQVLAQVEAASQAFPTLYQGLYQQMHALSVAAEAAIVTQHWQKLGKLMNIYHGLLDALGVSDAKLSELVYQARADDGVLGAKISGSGLGDCIIALSEPNAPLSAEGKLMDAVISPTGIQIERG